MRVVLVQADGMADEPIADLGGKTPLEVARTPHLDRMASRGILGLARTIPRGLPAEGEVGSMSVLGYDPSRYHTGLAPLEAAALGVSLGVTDVAVRLDLLALGPRDDGVEVLQHLGAPLLPEEGRTLLDDLARALAREGLEFHAVAGQCLLVVWRAGEHRMRSLSPRGLANRPLEEALPSGPGAEVLRSLIDDSRQVLASHPVCAARRARGEVAPSVVWPWGQGRRPRLQSLRERFGVGGAVAADVPYVQGLGALAGLWMLDPQSDMAGKAASGLAALATHDLVWVQVKGPDDGGHAGDAAQKVAAIERLDAELIGPLLDGLRAGGGEWRMLVMPDHPTPCVSRRHTDDPVPFVVAVSRDDEKPRGQDRQYHERDAREQGIFIPAAHTLMERLLRR